MKIFKLIVASIITLIIGCPIMFFLVITINFVFELLISSILEAIYPDAFMMYKLAEGNTCLDDGLIYKITFIYTILLLIIVLEWINSRKPREIKSYKEILNDAKD